MKTEVTIAELLRWRLAQAERQAPQPPRVALLLELARPWWETWPEKFQALVERVGRIQVAYGHAMAEATPSRTGHPVAALIVCGAEQGEACAQVLYLNVRDGRLRIRFQLDTAPANTPEAFEATFVAAGRTAPLLSAPAVLSVDSEYRIEAELSEELARQWELLKVTDRMPFRLILRSDKDAA
jgi:hypothetical protein